jgi:lysophospholipase L1-like esterase
MPCAFASPLPQVMGSALLVLSGLITMLAGCSTSSSEATSVNSPSSSSDVDGAEDSSQTSETSPACRWCSDRPLGSSESKQDSVVVFPAPGAGPESPPEPQRMDDATLATGPVSNPGLRVADPSPLSGSWVSAWGGRGPLSTTITTDRTFQDPVPDLSDRTLRIMAHVTAAGSQVRVRFSQRFSSSALELGAAHVAIRSSGSAIVAATDRALTFGGAAAVSVPAGGDVWSDPVDLAVAVGDDLAISVYVPSAFIPTTAGGRGQLKTSYHQAGNAVSAESLPQAQRTAGIFVAYEVQVLSPDRAATVVALGDSITEGACSTLDSNGDWPDLLAQRQPSLHDGARLAVFNAGIGSGRFASSDGAGLRGLSRLDELLDLPNVAWVVLLMGVNDISYEHVDAAFLQDAYARAIQATHDAGARIIGIPILPFGGSVKDVGNNVQIAREVNDWIRAHDQRLGVPEQSFDAVVDLEDVVKDPLDPGWALLRQLTCDGVHPNQAGYSAIANAVPLEVFAEAPACSGSPDAGACLQTRAAVNR